jgi:Tfp pilus assembly protein PilX
MTHQHQQTGLSKFGSDERGIALMTVMMLTLMTGVLGVAALTMTGLENSMASAVRMVEEGTHAAESCIGSSVRIINLAMEDPSMAAGALVVVAPNGPVPALNAAFLSQEINGVLRNNQDIAVGAGNAPNLVMNVNNYVINGDIDFLYSNQKTGDNIADPESLSVTQTYRVDCTAANTITGATSRVIAVYECLQKTGEGCTRRTGV